MSRIRCPLNETAWINQKDPGCIDRNRVLFYPQLDAAADQVVSFLKERGVAEGGVVVVQAAPQWRWVSLLFGCLRHGVILAPLDVNLPDAARDEALKELKPALVISDAGEIRLDDLCATGGDVVAEKDMGYDLEQPATILQSSGSTGSGRFWLHTVQAHYYAALGSNRHVTLKSKRRWLVSLPLHHAGGLGILFRCTMAGAAIAFPDPKEELGEEVLLYRATHLSLVPTQLRRLMRHPDAEDLAGQLQVILLGGAPCPDDLFREALEAGFPVRKTYGMTETLGQVTTVPDPATEAQQHLSGTLLPYREIRVTDESEIQVRGETLAEGLWNGGDVEAVTGEGGWYATGDLGSLDGENGLLVKGRKDNLFISGGENIVPEEIEAVLLKILDCEQAVVVPAPCREFGQRAVAFLDIPEEDLVPDSIIEALRDELPAFKIPREYRSLPPQEGLKTSRHKLRDLVS